jgi:UDP-N-acetylmuramyl pentapeptide synthase
VFRSGSNVRTAKTKSAVEAIVCWRTVQDNINAGLDDLRAEITSCSLPAKFRTEVSSAVVTDILHINSSREMDRHSSHCSSRRYQCLR